MKSKRIWLVASCLIVATMLVTSCAPAAVEEKAMQHNERGVALAMEGNCEQAILEFNKAIELAPELARCWHDRGIAYSMIWGTMTKPLLIMIRPLSWTQR